MTTTTVGSQAVADVPVLTRCDVADFGWASRAGRAAVNVFTNTRSLPEADAARVTREVVANTLAAAPGVCATRR